MLSVDDLHLEAGQHIQHLFVEALVEGVGAGGVHDDGGLGVLTLEHHRVAHHTDVADQTHQLDLVGSFRQNGGDGGIGYIHAKDQLVDGGGFHLGQGFGGLAVDLPAVAALDAVLHRQVPAFPGGQVVFKMGVPGKEDMPLAVGADLGGDLFIQLFCTGEAQCTVHKVVLIVNDKQIPVHRDTS